MTESLKALATNLPPLYCGFEVRLSPPSNRVDFGCGFFTSEDWKRWIHSPHFSPQFSAIPEWKRIRDFIDEQTKTGSTLSRGVHMLLFEFDCDENLRFSLLPALFFYFERPKEARPHTEEEKDLWRICLKRAYHLLRGEEVNFTLESHWEACLEALPKNARLMGAGLFLDRAFTPFRLTVASLQWDAVQGFLGRLGYREDEEQFAETRAIIGENVSIRLGLDITSQGVVRVGYLVLKPQTDSGFIERLPISQEQKTALRDWEHREEISSAIAPLELQRLQVFVPQSKLIRSREIFHYKMGRNQQGAWEIKAYLTLQDTLISRSSVQQPLR